MDDSAAEGRMPPFPLLPPMFQICSILGALYPNFDIVDDIVKFQTGPLQLRSSLHALSLGSCLLLLGYYCCQFVPSLLPLRREYLGSLALVQAGRLLVLLGLAAFFFRDAVLAAPASTACTLLSSLAVALLVLNDAAAEPGPAPPPKGGKDAGKAPQLPSARAQGMVAAASHALWLVGLLQFGAPLVAPLLLPEGRLAGALAEAGGPYGWLAVVASLGVGSARLWVYVQGVREARRLKEKTE